MIQTKKSKWQFANYFPKLLDAAVDRVPLKFVANDLNISVYEVSKLIRQHIPFYHLNRDHGQIKLFKNTDLVYCANNINASYLGDRLNDGDLGNVTDYDISSEFADEYIAMDLNTIKTLDITTAKKIVEHRQFGRVYAVGHSTPVFDDHGDCCGVFIFSHLDIKLSAMSFIDVISHLRDGSAKHFIRKQSYSLSLDGRMIKLHPRQVECLLYYMAGFSNKEIARFMQINPRSVEGHITRFKDVTGAANRSSIIELLFHQDLLKRL